jgi:hypothetical protein
MTTTNSIGRAVAQAVSRWLPTAAARVRFRAACGVCGGRSGTGGRFSPSTSVSPANHSTNFSIIITTRGWHNRPLVATVPCGPNWTPPPTIPIKKKSINGNRHCSPQIRDSNTSPTKAIEAREECYQMRDASEA